jgi:hypothetical protein
MPHRGHFSLASFYVSLSQKLWVFFATLAFIEAHHEQEVCLWAEICGKTHFRLHDTTFRVGLWFGKMSKMRK